MIDQDLIQIENLDATEAKSLPLRIAGEMAEAINTAEEREIPMVFAYLDQSGTLRQSYRGSIHVHEQSQLAFWNRDPNGGFIKALKAGKTHVCTTYRETDSPRVLHFAGRARVIEDEDEAKRVWSESPELERKLTHGQNGVAVLIELESVRGIDRLSETGEWAPFVMLRG